MTRWFRTFVILIALVSTASAQQKKRVAVFDFDYVTVRDAVSSVFGTNVDVGKGVADLIVQDLVKAGVYSVVERNALEKVLAEQNLSNSDRADATTAAKVGKILGVDAIIIGNITQFGADDKTTNVAGGALGNRLGKLGIGGVARKESKAVVGLSARLVNTDNAEIVTAASGKGESKRTGTSMLGTGGSSAGIAGTGVNMTSSNFAQTIIGEALTAAVSTLSKELNGNAGKVTTRTVAVDGLVADVTGNTVVLNVGTKAGVKVGDKLQIKRTSRDIKDPATGKVIRRIEDTVGEVLITDADETSAVGTFTGSNAPTVGDRAVSAQ